MPPLEASPLSGDGSERLLDTLPAPSVIFRAAHTPMRPKLKTVPLEEVRRHLPADAPNVSVRERHERMVRRLASVYRRRCGDF